MQSCRAQSQQVHLQNTPSLGLREHCRQESGKIVKARRSGSLLGDCVRLSPNNVKSYPLKVSLTGQSKHELNKGNSRHARVNQGKPKRPQAYTKSSRGLRKVPNGKKSLLQGRAHQLVVRYQVVSP